MHSLSRFPLPLAALFAAGLLSACSDSAVVAPDLEGYSAPSTEATVPANAVAGLTSQPDLIAVGGFRDGGLTDDGTALTLVDFRFDAPAEIAGGDRSNFKLVPVDGGAVVRGTGLLQNATDPSGDDVVTVEFGGALSAADFARGFVDAEVVRPAGSMGSAGNPLQAADVSNGGNTGPDPDLAEVTYGVGRLVYRFDQPVAGSGDVQDTQGFTAYDAAGTEYQANVIDAGTGDDATVDVFFDLPQGTALADLVGASVDEGTVAAVGNDDATNSPDEVAISGTPPEVCPITSVSNGGDGPTTAPDLVSVGNFRAGPPDDAGNPTTCVDFTFDEDLELAGGDRTNVKLVRAAPNADGETVIEATGRAPSGEVAGDSRLTLVFGGALSAADFARGFVDAEVVRPAGSTGSAGNPLQAADVADGGNSSTPDLVAVRRQGLQLIYVFDEPLGTDDVIQDTGGFVAYDAAGNEVQSAAATATVGGTEVGVSFDDFAVADAVGASVNQGAVAGTDAANNDPDEVLVEGRADPDLSAITECVVDNGDGTLTARFGYENREGYTVRLPQGSANRLVGPVLSSTGPVTAFPRPEVVPGRPGRTPFDEGVFTATFSASETITWSLDGRTATAGGATQRCP